MAHSLYPNERMTSAYLVPYEELARLGYRGILFDIDNTLVPHGAPATEEAKKLFERIRRCGLATCLISNNRKARVQPFAEAVQSPFLSLANKPFPSGYRKACGRMGVPEKDAVFIGDQIFTDVWGANLAGIRSILVNPINPREEIQIVLKRRLERLILRAYHRGGYQKVKRIFPGEVKGRCL